MKLKIVKWSPSQCCGHVLTRDEIEYCIKHGYYDFIFDETTWKITGVEILLECCDYEMYAKAIGVKVKE